MSISSNSPVHNHVPSLIQNGQNGRMTDPNQLLVNSSNGSDNHHLYLVGADGYRWHESTFTWRLPCRDRRHRRQDETRQDRCAANVVQILNPAAKQPTSQKHPQVNSVRWVILEIRTDCEWLRDIRYGFHGSSKWLTFRELLSYLMGLQSYSITYRGPMGSLNMCVGQIIPLFLVNELNLYGISIHYWLNLH
jgi:hypothetical protein